jgi:hypothetical protein
MPLTSPYPSIIVFSITTTMALPLLLAPFLRGGGEERSGGKDDESDDEQSVATVPNNFSSLISITGR